MLVDHLRKLTANDDEPAEEEDDEEDEDEDEDDGEEEEEEQQETEQQEEEQQPEDPEEEDDDGVMVASDRTMLRTRLSEVQANLEALMAHKVRDWHHDGPQSKDPILEKLEVHQMHDERDYWCVAGATAARRSLGPEAAWGGGGLAPLVPCAVL